ncbi:MAG: lactate dehydrogenase [Oscillospiraceae bacterium]
MHHYYTYDGRTLCSAGALPYPEISALPETGEVLWVFHRPPLSGRDTFPVTDPAQLTEREGVASLCAAPGPEGLPRELTNAIRAGRVRAVNLAHPRFEELMAPLTRPEKVRVNLLALGDVGSTLLMGLRLMGGDVISSIGICDLREGVAQRWEFELNQIQLPGPYDTLPPVEIVSPEQLFDGDVFLFCASRFVPDTAVKTGDVRMAQYRLNRELAALYAQKARQARYRGLFCVVSDPVDPLCRAVLTESNRAPSGEMDYQGLFSHQVRGFGLGVMNARAAYYARKDPRFASFLTEGRTFGPHGEDLVVANSIDRYDDGLSRLLTERTVHANLQMREMGFKPYAAPALSSGALSLLLCLRGQWHCSSTYLDGVFMGARNRVLPTGTELERLPLPQALRDRLQTTMDRLRAID